MDTLTKYVIISVVSLFVVYSIIHFGLRKLGKDPKNILPHNIANRIKAPMITLLLAIALQVGLLRENVFTNPRYHDIFQHIRTLLLILSFAWFIIVGVRIFKKELLNRFDVTTEDNLRARKYYTQFNILERIVVFIVTVLAIGIALLTFDGIKEIGVSVLTSAGIAGIILGFSAQKAIGTLLAGIQIAITQPIRIDDVVIVEGEWGRIEEITLTYVVVRIWDKRRLVVPTTYFIDTPFENWTRSSSDILGTVYLYTDYGVPLEELRTEMTRLLYSTDLWDGEVNVIQVTDTSEKSMEVRALMSARDSSIAWDLRVFIRENLLEFLRKNYPKSLPLSRVSLNKTHHSE